MAIRGSVFAGLAGNTTTSVTMPEAGLTIVGFQIGTTPYIQIPIDSGRNAVLMVPGGPNRSMPYLFKVHFKLDSSTISIFNGYSAQTGIVIFYGDGPLPGSRPLEDYAGVVASASFSSTGATSDTVDVEFPSGDLRLSGLSASFSGSEQWVSVQWNTSSGKMFGSYFFNNASLSADNYYIVPIDFSTAATLPITVSVSSAVSDTVYIAFYYRMK